MKKIDDDTKVVTGAQARTMVAKIISGGQTGADQGALLAAKSLGIATGGWMPQGWLTSSGPRPELQDLYGMQEHASPKYPPRTYDNVRDAHATMIFGEQTSPGCMLTRSACSISSKPIFWVSWPSRKGMGAVNVKQLRDWLVRRYEDNGNQAIVLNVAGNREEKNTGIEQAVHDFLVSTLS